jgi:hypothetical protein
MQRRLLLICGFLSATIPIAVPAQDMLRVRGTIERLEGPGAFVVKSRDGHVVKVVVQGKPIYTAVVKASLADIKPGQFVGATAVPGAGGKLEAVEVHIFPEAMRGVGEGHRPWDLMPKSTMTNAAVEQSVAGVDGRTLTLKYNGGEKQVIVTPQTVVVTYANGDVADLKPGVAIFVGGGAPQPDGSIRTSRITYGRDGLIPPM